MRPNRRGSPAAGRDAVGKNERPTDDVLDALGGQDAVGPGQQGMVYRGRDHLFRDQGYELVVIAEFQSPFKALDAFRKSVVSCVLIGHVSV
mgnify:FL=1